MRSRLRPGPALAGVTWGQTTTGGGVSEGAYASLNLAGHVGESPEITADNWALLSGDLGFGRAEIATCEQVHGRDVLCVGHGGHKRLPADALVSTKRHLGVGVYTADCVPVLYAVPGRGVAAAHCGWRGTAAGLAGATLEVLAKAAHVRADEVEIWLGPAIAQCSYEVGEELTEVFDARYMRERGGGKYELDVSGAVVADLLACGADASRIRRSPVDTYRDRSCYSYRRDGSPTGRMLSYVRLE